MSTPMRSPRILLALISLLGLTILATPPATAARVPGCVAEHLAIARGPVQGATGHRYDEFRITNTGTSACRLFGYPTFRFVRDGQPIGWRSEQAGVPAHVVRLAPGAHTRITVGTVNPMIPMSPPCRVARADAVRIRLAYRPHVYTVPIRIRVCTAKRYRPVSYPVGF
jgi:hypothetical protein